MTDRPDTLTARRGLMLVLSSPSGAGKTTIARRLLADDAEMALSVSVTTRPARSGEVDGRDYHFVGAARFETMVAAGEMLEHAVVFGHAYGTPRAPVAAALAAGSDVLFDVDWQGTQQLRACDLGEALVSVFILPPSMAELARRLRGRGLDSDSVVAGRMARAMDEISHWAEYDYVLVNDDLERCVAAVRGIVATERLRRVRRPGLVDVVARLNAEFASGAGR